MHKPPPSFLHSLLLQPRFLIGGGALLILILAAALAPLLSPHDPAQQNLLNTLLPPAWNPLGVAQYPLGSDSLGRDILSRLLHGARAALLVAFLAAAGAALLGSFLGALAASRGPILDAAVSRGVDVWTSFPPVLLAIVIAAFIGAGLHAVIIAVTLIDWTRFHRVVRSEILAQRSLPYADAALSLGRKPFPLLIHDVLPNILPPFITLFSLEMGVAVTVETILSFVGLSSTQIPSWGGVLQDARPHIWSSPWSVVFPTCAVIITILALHTLGDAVRRSADPLTRP